MGKVGEHYANVLSFVFSLQIEPGGALDELTKRYGAELKTHYHHVLEALRFQAEMAATQFDQDNYSNDVSEE